MNPKLYAESNFKGRLAVMISAGMLLFSSLACGMGIVDDPTPTPPPTATLQPTDTPEPTATPEPVDTPQPQQPSGSTYTLEVENLTSDSICYVYISPEQATDWGTDKLGADNVIPAGQSYSFHEISSGIYDLKAETCDEREVERYDVEINEDLTWTLTD